MLGLVGGIFRVSRLAHDRHQYHVRQKILPVMPLVVWKILLFPVACPRKNEKISAQNDLPEMYVGNINASKGQEKTKDMSKSLDGIIRQRLARDSSV